MADKKNSFIKPMGTMIPIENDSRSERRERIKESLVGIKRNLRDESEDFQLQKKIRGVSLFCMMLIRYMWIIVILIV